MIWLTERERITLTMLGVAALVGVGVVWWQQQRAPIRVESGPQSPPYAQWDALVQQARQVNINQATAEEFERLPEIGPSIAQRIVEYRSIHGAFHSPEELLEVRGIGPKTFEAIQEHVTVGGNHAASH